MSSCLDVAMHRLTASRSLARDNKHAVEREQAIKLIRAIVEIGSQRTAGFGTGKVPLTEAIMRALIAVAEHPEDPFKPICLQTITEIRAFFFSGHSACRPSSQNLLV